MPEEPHKAQTRRQAMIVWTYIEKKEAFDRSKNGFERNRNEESEAASQKKSFSDATKIAPTPRSSGEEEEGTATTTTTKSEHSRPLSLSFFLSLLALGTYRLPIQHSSTDSVDDLPGFHPLTPIYGLHLHMRWLAAWPGFLHRTNAPATGKTPKGTGFNRLIYYT
jgi:hypothetical protein